MSSEHLSLIIHRLKSRSIGIRWTNFSNVLQPFPTVRINHTICRPHKKWTKEKPIINPPKRIGWRWPSIITNEAKKVISADRIKKRTSAMNKRKQNTRLRSIPLIALNITPISAPTGILFIKNSNCCWPLHSIGISAKQSAEQTACRFGIR